MEHISIPCRKADKAHNKTVEIWTPVSGLWMISVKAQGGTYAMSVRLSDEDMVQLTAFIRNNASVAD